jgi:hypothetical protein
MTSPTSSSLQAGVKIGSEVQISWRTTGWVRYILLELRTCKQTAQWLFVVRCSIVAFVGSPLFRTQQRVGGLLFLPLPFNRQFNRAESNPTIMSLCTTATHVNHLSLSLSLSLSYSSLYFQLLLLLHVVHQTPQ